tara:strand:+ start:564 stop:1559 length:996 start_codon:yes stop_codon:yes gene_type:complete
MNFLIIGLGSMGKRRIRCLKSLGYNKIVGFDIDQERAADVGKEYLIEIHKQEVSKIIEEQEIDGVIISTSPDQHTKYIELCIERQVSCFVEASVTDIEGLKSANNRANKMNVLVCPSCTMKYYNGPKRIKELIANEKIIGKCLYFNYVTGQYLPDWHPWEDIKDYYVSNRETGGARELVPFELTWLNDTFGKASVINAVKKKLSDMDADIDDFYNFTLQYDNIIGNITIEVLSRPVATRKLIAVGSQGVLNYCGSTNKIIVENVGDKERIEIELEKGNVQESYINPEEPYISEIKDFIDAIKYPNTKNFTSSLHEDICLLELLEKIEKNAK